MLLEVFLVLVFIAGGFMLLGYSTETYFYSIFGFAILFYLGTMLMGLNADDGILFKVGENEVVNYVYDNGTVDSETKAMTYVYEAFSNFLFGLLMTFISLIGMFLILMNTRSKGFDDE